MVLRCARASRARELHYHSAIVRNIPISLMVNIFCKISAQKDPTVQRKSRLVKKNCRNFLLKFLVSTLIDIINTPEEFQKNRWSRSPFLKVAQTSAVKLFWNF